MTVWKRQYFGNEERIGAFQGPQGKGGALEWGTFCIPIAVGPHESTHVTTNKGRLNLKCSWEAKGGPSRTTSGPQRQAQEEGPSTTDLGRRGCLASQGYFTEPAGGGKVSLLAQQLRQWKPIITLNSHFPATDFPFTTIPPNFLLSLYKIMALSLAWGVACGFAAPCLYQIAVLCCPWINLFCWQDYWLFYF